MARRRQSLSSSERSSSSGSNTSSQSVPATKSKPKHHSKQYSPGCDNKSSRKHYRSRSRSPTKNKYAPVKHRGRSHEKKEKTGRKISEESGSKKVSEKGNKTLFPIAVKEDLKVKKKNKDVITTLVSYPNLTSSVAEEGESGRRHSSEDRFKIISSEITVKRNGPDCVREGEQLKEARAREREQKEARAREEGARSLREQVGWDPFQGNTSSTFGDHDDRQLTRGFNDSYTRRDARRGSEPRRAPGARLGPTNSRFQEMPHSFRERSRPGPARSDGLWSNNRSRTGPARSDGLWSNNRSRPGPARSDGLWSNNRTFRREEEPQADRSGMNDNKWKRDLFVKE